MSLLRAIRDAELGAARPRAAIGGGVSLPTGNDFGMLGDPGAIVVFGLEIDRAQASHLFQRLGASRDANRPQQEGRDVI